MTTGGVWQAGKRFAQQATQSVVDFVCPPTCVICRSDQAFEAAPTDAQLTDGPRLTLDSESWPLICPTCIAGLNPVSNQPTCGRCGAPAGQYLDVSSGCVHCQNDRFAFDKVIALGVYADSMRSACLQAKQPAGRLVAAGLGQALIQHFGPQLLAENVDLVLPVPRHWSHKLKSSYSASLSLAEIVSNCLKAPMLAHILQKSRRTASQSSLPPSKRRSNLRGAFRIRRFLVPGARKLNGSTALLVDDILTTGSTAHEVSRVLKKAGVQRVIVAVVARGIASSSVSTN